MSIQLGTKKEDATVYKDLSVLYPQIIQKAFSKDALNQITNKKLGTALLSNPVVESKLTFVRQQAQANIIKTYTDEATAQAVKGATDAFQKQLTEAQIDYQAREQVLLDEVTKKALEEPYTEKKLEDTTKTYTELVTKYNDLLENPKSSFEFPDILGAFKDIPIYVIIAVVAILGIVLITRRK